MKKRPARKRRPSKRAIRAAFTLYTGAPCAADLPRCPECGMGYERFNSLAYHRANDCPARQTGLQENSMAKTRSKSRNRDDRQSRRDDRGRGRSDYPPYLTADDLPERGAAEFTIADSITLYQGDDGRASFFIQVKDRGGKVYTWSVRTNSPDRISLYNQIGRNLIEWPGEKIKLEAVQGDRGGWFVNMVESRQRDR